MGRVHVIDNTGAIFTDTEFATVAGIACDHLRKGHVRKLYFESSAASGIIEQTGKGKYVSGVGTLFKVQMDAVLGTARSAVIIVYDGISEHVPDSNDAMCAINRGDKNGFKTSFHQLDKVETHFTQ